MKDNEAEDSYKLPSLSIRAFPSMQKLHYFKDLKKDNSTQLLIHRCELTNNCVYT